MVKRTKSVKRPEDEFNFKTGAGYAFTRIFADDKLDKEEFKPHLKSKVTGDNYGAIGEATKYRDIVNVPLFVGDIVSVFDNDTCYSHSFVVKDMGKHFVMGIESACTDGLIQGFKVLKIKDFKDLVHGENHYTIEAVLKEDEYRGEKKCQ